MERRRETERQREREWRAIPHQDSLKILICSGGSHRNFIGRMFDISPPLFLFVFKSGGSGNLSPFLDLYMRCVRPYDL